ncbi:MAG TPA: tape measure protein [Polyangiaceae bacterium]|nr:tape measure protein [Polyangiaceae bacterium]
MDDASFTMQMIDEVTGPVTAMKAAIGDIKAALGEAGAAAGGAGDALKVATKDIKKTTDALKGMDDAMAHQKWVAMKQAEVLSQKAAFAAKQHADGLGRVAALGTPLDKLVMGPLKFVAKWGAIAATAVGAGLGFIAAKFSRATLAAASFQQNSVFALTELTGSASIAGKEFDDVSNMAVELGLNVQDSVKGFTKLVAAQFSIGQSKEILRMGADLRTVGASADNVKAAILAITQIKSKGKLQSEELMQLQEANVPGGRIMDALQKNLGKSRDEVQALLQGGKIDADTGVQAIMDAIKAKTGESTLGEAGKKWADTTLEGFWGKMTAGFDMGMIDIGKRILPSLNAIATLASGTLDKLTKSGKLQQLGETIVAGFQKFTGWLQSNWPAVESIIVGTIDFIIKGVWMVVDVLGFMADNWGTIKTVLQGIGIVLGVVAAGAVLMMAPFLLVGAAIVTIVAAIAFVIGWVTGKLIPAFVAFGTAVSETVGSIIEPFKNAFDTIAAIFDSTGTSWTEKFLGIGMAIVTGLANGIAAMMTAPVELVWNLGKNIISAFKTVLGIASPSTVMVEAGIDTVGGVPIGVDKEAAAAIASVTGVATDISDAFTGALAMKTPASEVTDVFTGQPLFRKPELFAPPQAMTETAPTLEGANAQAASVAAQSVSGPGDGGGMVVNNNISVTVDGAQATDPRALATDIASVVHRELVKLLQFAAQ